MSKSTIPAYKLLDDLFLVEVQVPVSDTAVSKVEGAINHVWIFDRSGSMHNQLPELVADLKAKVSQLKVGDSLSLAWFSGEGQHEFVLKGLQVANCEVDHKKLHAVLDLFVNSVGCTCFSEILKDLIDTMPVLKTLNSNVSLLFLTDGHPVVSNYQRELEAIDRLLVQLNPHLVSAVFIGYRDHYNRDLMLKMASAVGGTLVHASGAKQTAVLLEQFVTDSRQSGVKVEVSLPTKSDLGVVFGVQGSSVQVFAPDGANKILFGTQRKNRNAVYVVSSQLPANCTLAKEDLHERYHYAVAKVLSQRGRSDLALRVLGSLGDVALVEALGNAFTVSEYGEAESAISRAVRATSGRFTKGRKVGCVPKKDAFCLVDLADLLAGDAQARFFPYHEDFEYNRIGRKTVQSTGPVFTPNKEQGCELAALTWNDSRLNLSITVQITGTVPLDERAAKLGLASPFPTMIWRTFTLVRDGAFNLPEIFCSVSRETWDKLVEVGVISAEAGEWKKDKVVSLRLPAVPIMNLSMAEGRCSAKEAAKAALSNLKMQAQLKAVKAEIEKLEATGTTNLLGKSRLSAEQEKYLAEFHIKPYGFSPPAAPAGPVTDTYTARGLDIKIKGATLPSIKDALEKRTGGKKISLGAKLLLESYDDATAIANGQSPAVALAKLNTLKVTTNVELRHSRKLLQRDKFAVILGKRWYSEFKGRDEKEIEVDGQTITFEVEETIEKI